MKNGCFTQLSFTFGRFFGQDMTFVRLFALKSTGTGFLEALACAAMAFHFWHLFSPIVINKIPEIKPSEAKCLAPSNFQQLVKPQGQNKLSNNDSLLNRKAV
jgi:hypothetical protein